MTKYRKIAPIEAEQFDGSDEMIKKYHLGFWKGIDTNIVYEYSIPTLEGTMDLGIGDWIATGANGEHWLIADSVFKKTYEAVSSSCPYCHGDGSRVDNESLWGSRLIQGINEFDKMAINLSKCQLVSANALHTFPINYCPLCGRKLSD